jgi:hypothetical protein
MSALWHLAAASFWFAPESPRRWQNYPDQYFGGLVSRVVGHVFVHGGDVVKDYAARRC